MACHELGHIAGGEWWAAKLYLYWQLLPITHFPVAQMVKCLPTMQETRVQTLGWEDLEKKWQPTPGFLPGKSHGWRSLVGLQSMGLQRVGHDWATSLSPSLALLPELCLLSNLQQRNKWDALESPRKHPLNPSLSMEKVSSMNQVPDKKAGDCCLRRFPLPSLCCNFWKDPEGNWAAHPIICSIIISTPTTTDRLESTIYKPGAPEWLTSAGNKDDREVQLTTKDLNCTPPPSLTSPMWKCFNICVL